MTGCPKNKVLDLVFLPRKKVGFYNKIPFEHVQTLQEVFIKSPYPNKDVVSKLAQETNQSENKIRDWFKSQRKKDFSTSKQIVKALKFKHSFSRKETEILESAFRVDSMINKKKIEELNNNLKCSAKHIKQWFQYRNRKLKKIIKPARCEYNDSKSSAGLETTIRDSLSNSFQKTKDETMDSSSTGNQNPTYQKPKVEESRRHTNESSKSQNALQKNMFQQNMLQQILFQQNVLQQNMLQQNNVLNQNVLQQNTLKPNMLQPNTLQPNMLQLNVLQPNMPQPNIPQPNMPQPNMLQPNMLQSKMSNQNMLQLNNLQQTNSSSFFQLNALPSNSIINVPVPFFSNDNNLLKNCGVLFNNQAANTMPLVNFLMQNQTSNMPQVFGLIPKNPSRPQNGISSANITLNQWKPNTFLYAIDLKNKNSFRNI